MLKSEFIVSTSPEAYISRFAREAIRAADRLSKSQLSSFIGI